MQPHLWILTEERPKIKVLKIILQKFLTDYNCSAFVDNLRIIPVLDSQQFTFTYEVIGFRCNKVNKVFIKTVSGYSSFVDFLVFYQIAEPCVTDLPIYTIEETKTDDKESRNTGVYQRCTKFVFLQNYYPKVKKIMLYHLQVEQKEKPTETYIFGTRLLLTLGVEIMGKNIDNTIFKPFQSIDELVDFKEKMRKAPKGNVPISISLNKEENKIQVTGRLYKNNGLSHDPNIGALSIICAVLRQLGWNKQIEISKHGLAQQHIGVSNKFIQIANLLNISLEGLALPNAQPNTTYWKYDKEGEKLGTVFIHLVVESFTEGESIFENHAGCEKGYFFTKEGKPISLAKYKDREKYKEGDKSQIINIPDLVLIDFGRNEIINIEGKRYKFMQKGIKELENYDFIENNYIKKHYPDFKINRTLVLYGGKSKQIIEVKVGFLLNEFGDLILGVQAPSLLADAIKNLLDFWAS